MEFQLKSFRFASSSNPDEEQEQLFSCSIHIDPIDSASAADSENACSCFTQEECSEPAEKSVLILSTHVAANVPQVVSFDGKKYGNGVLIYPRQLLF